MIEEKRDELMELSHEANPLYRKIFFGVFIVCAVYLAFIFLRS